MRKWPSMGDICCLAMCFFLICIDQHQLRKKSFLHQCKCRGWSHKSTSDDCCFLSVHNLFLQVSIVIFYIILYFPETILFIQIPSSIPNLIYRKTDIRNPLSLLAHERSRFAAWILLFAKQSLRILPVNQFLYLSCQPLIHRFCQFATQWQRCERCITAIQNMILCGHLA